MLFKPHHFPTALGDNPMIDKISSKQDQTQRITSAKEREDRLCRTPGPMIRWSPLMQSIEVPFKPGPLAGPEWIPSTRQYCQLVSITNTASNAPTARTPLAIGHMPRGYRMTGGIGFTPRRMINRGIHIWANLQAVQDIHCIVYLQNMFWVWVRDFDHDSWSWSWLWSLLWSCL